MNALRACQLACASFGLAMGTSCGEPQRPIEPWPPVVGKPFPDMTALDQRGRSVQLSSLQGKVLLIEPIGMSCPGCVAFCGGHEYGAFEGYEPQEDVSSLESYLPDYANGTELSDEDIVVVEMLFFNPSMETPTLEDAVKWHNHFRLGQRPNHIVLIGPESIRDAAFACIPGYWLVDRDFVLRRDSTGHRPRHNLYSDLMPLVPRLLSQHASAPPR